MEQDLRQHIKGDVCGKCGGEADDWKCPACGKSAKIFDAFHWKNCQQGGKMHAQCNACGEAEDNCRCKPSEE